MIKDTIVYSVGRVVSASIGFFSIVYYSSIFDPGTYAVYALVLSFVNVVNLSAFQWLKVLFVRDVCFGDECVSTLNLYFQLLLLVMGVSFFVSFFTESNVVKYFSLMILVCSLSELTLENLRSEGKSIKYSIQYIIRQATIAFFTVIFSYYFLEASLVLGYSLGCVVSLCMGWSGLQKRLFSKKIELWKIDLIFIKENFPVMVGFTASSLMNNLDKVLVIIYLGRDIGGVYSLVNDLVKQSIMIVLEAVNLSAFPRVARSMKKQGLDAAINSMNVNYKLLVTVGILSISFFTVFGDILVIEFLGSSYYSGVVIIPFVAMAAFFRGLRAYYFDQYFMIFGKKYWMYYSVFFSIVTMLVLYQALFYFDDILAASLINALVFFLSIIYSFYFSKKVIDYHVPVVFTVTVLVFSMVYVFVNFVFDLTVGFDFFTLFSFCILVVFFVICVFFINRGINS